MNAAQLAMITAYAQAQQIAGNWNFDEDGEQAWYDVAGDGRLIMGDEGWAFEPAQEGGQIVAIKTLSQLIQLLA